MARSNRVFVSPGVYTSEKELSFVSQSVGITTLGMVGETLKGPAFEPILVGSYDEYVTYFGGTSPAKFQNGMPQYELPYFAKSYLTQSSQLFVTRVLGLTGYKPGNSWVIKTISADSGYTDIAVAVLRSRGHYTTGNTLSLKVTAASGVTMSGSGVTSNPYTEFTISAGGKSFTCSMDKTSKKYITKALGTAPFDKDETEFPVYVHETYADWLKNAWSLGKITGLSLTLEVGAEGANFNTPWQTAVSPYIVSEVRGGKVADLFRFITVSDGEGANTEVKVSIANINLETLEFDVLVRAFEDTDDAPAILEKFSRCSMNAILPGYIAKKIGTSNGEYELKSRYIMVELKDEHPQDAVPAGFGGYPLNPISGSTAGHIMYKTKYLKAGDVESISASGLNELSNGDKLRKTYLGMSSKVKADTSVFKFKGSFAAGKSKGFHLSVNASGITDATTGKYVYQTTTMDFEASASDFATAQGRKFTLGFYGGFDGWDIFRPQRTNTDSYVYGKAAYTAGIQGNGGVFNLTDADSDYYAFKQGIETFNNTEAVNINVFATPGINFYDHSLLVGEAIDVVEIDRADCLYVINAPNRDTVDEVIDDLDVIGLDSNYSATFFPWIQVRDVENSAQVYLPPTGEVLRNIALTDNVAHPWFASAGYNRGIVNAIKAKKKLNNDERDDLYKSRINPIATFSDVGPIIWGNKTLQVKESPLDRINVRRLLLQARKLISAVAIRLLFEQNDEQVRAEFEKLVNPILQAIKNERGLTDFKVVVSHSVEDMDRNTLRGKIFIKPTRALEYIDIEFVVTPTGASFENI